MEGVLIQPHIQLSRAQVNPICVACGDPDRCELFASICDSFEVLKFNRQYKSFNCVYQGINITCISHGIGCPSSVICLEELIELGAKVFIRFGSCGSLQPKKLKHADIINIHAAVREEKLSSMFIDTGYPAVADIQVVNAIQNAFKALTNKECTLGYTVSSDLFYAPAPLGPSHQKYHEAGVEVVEMEASALFVVGRIRGIRTGCICVVDGCPMQWEEGDYKPSSEEVVMSKTLMCEVVRNTCFQLSKELGFTKSD